MAALLLEPEDIYFAIYLFHLQDEAPPVPTQKWLLARVPFEQQRCLEPSYMDLLAPRTLREIYMNYNVDPMSPKMEIHRILGEELADYKYPEKVLLELSHALFHSGDVKDYERTLEVTATFVGDREPEIPEPHFNMEEAVLRGLVKSKKWDIIDFAIDQGHLEGKHILLSHDPEFWAEFIRNPNISIPLETFLVLLYRVLRNGGTHFRNATRDHVRFVLNCVRENKVDSILECSEWKNLHHTLVGRLLIFEECVTVRRFHQVLDEYKVAINDLSIVMVEYTSRITVSPVILKEALKLSPTWTNDVHREIMLNVGNLLLSDIKRGAFERYYKNIRTLLKYETEPDFDFLCGEINSTLLKYACSDSKRELKEVIFTLLDLYLDRGLPPSRLDLEMLFIARPRVAYQYVKLSSIEKVIEICPPVGNAIKRLLDDLQGIDETCPDFIDDTINYILADEVEQ